MEEPIIKDKITSKTPDKKAIEKDGKIPVWLRRHKDGHQIWSHQNNSQVQFQVEDVHSLAKCEECSTPFGDGPRMQFNCTFIVLLIRRKKSPQRKSLKRKTRTKTKKRSQERCCPEVRSFSHLLSVLGLCPLLLSWSLVPASLTGPSICSVLLTWLLEEMPN